LMAYLSDRLDAAEADLALAEAQRDAHRQNFNDRSSKSVRGT